MVKAKFIGDAENASFKCAEFNAIKGNTVNMPNERYTAIVAEGKQGLFEVIGQDDVVFPEQTTVG